MSLSATRAPSPPAPPHSCRRDAAGKDKFSGSTSVSPYVFIAFFIVRNLRALPDAAHVRSPEQWNLIAPERAQFIGLDNYTALLKDDKFWNATFNTLGLFLVATVPQILLALLIANMLNRGLRWRTFFRMSILVPNVTSVAAVGIVFATLFQRDYGVINWVLHFFSIDPINWRYERWGSWTALSAMVDWRWTGYNALIFLAGMQAIPKDLYESAAIDGASPRAILDYHAPCCADVTSSRSPRRSAACTVHRARSSQRDSPAAARSPYHTLPSHVSTHRHNSQACYGAATRHKVLMIILFSLFNSCASEGLR